MTSNELRSQLPLLAPAYFSDTSYAKPTLRWLTEEFYRWFWERRAELGLRNWARKNDCDNFARAYAQYAQDAHASSVGNDDEGLAVGEFWYHSANGPHAIVIAFTDEGRVFIEPQTGRTLILTQTEFNSCFFARF